MSQLVELSEAQRQLALVETPVEAKALYDKLETLSQYAKRYRLEHEQQNEIARAKLTTARKGGGLLAESVAGWRPHGVESRGETRLPEGITKSMSSRWQALARIPEPEFVRFLRNLDELTMKAAVRLGREVALREERQQQEEAAIAAIVGTPELSVAAIEDWRPAGVDAIVTDPPYIGEVIPLYEALRGFALDVLPEGGPLVVMTWQGILPDVVRALEHPDLVYRWTICWRFANAENTVDHSRRVFDCWKPVLVYHKNGMPKDAPMVRDEIANVAGDKDFHEWGQSLGGFERLVKSFSNPGQTICDPFLGGGTTALAALSQNRRFTGCDVSSDAVAITKARLAA